MPQESYRVSLSSATRSFLETCQNDMQGINIEGEIRKPGSYLLRFSPRDFGNFCNNVGVLSSA
ncbi:MAG: hypothetical protein H8Z69_02175 [Nanohaloarchaea archaeon]|nr:hypothetical protein [Candidatus Nanohaloarchaea archaeon]